MSEWQVCCSVVPQNRHCPFTLSYNFIYTCLQQLLCVSLTLPHSLHTSLACYFTTPPFSSFFLLVYLHDCSTYHTNLHSITLNQTSSLRSINRLALKDDIMNQNKTSKSYQYPSSVSLRGCFFFFEHRD